MKHPVQITVIRTGFTSVVTMEYGQTIADLRSELGSSGGGSNGSNGSGGSGGIYNIHNKQLPDTMPLRGDMTVKLSD